MSPHGISLCLFINILNVITFESLPLHQLPPPPPFRFPLDSVYLPVRCPQEPGHLGGRPSTHQGDEAHPISLRAALHPEK